MAQKKNEVVRPESMPRITTMELANKFIDEQVESIRNQVGDKKVLLALSGGVDSSVLAALLIKAVGKQLYCVHVNHGLMRKNESESVIEVFQKELDANLIYIDATDRFLDKLKNVAGPEEKRSIIGKEFIEVFAEEARKLKGVKYLAQGTIYPDIIESKKGHKAHHNVGGLPKDLKFKLVEPLELLYKDEVRVVGIALGLPESMVYRQPFPGPGLGVRILGDITPEKVHILQEADAIFVDMLREWKDENGVSLYNKVWQAGAILLSTVRSTGMKGDTRTYEHPVALRAVLSVDAMTADWARIPYEFLAKCSNEIINKVQGVNRVCYDISAKPPATIEWE